MSFKTWFNSPTEAERAMKNESTTKLFIIDSLKVILMSLAIIIPFRMLIAAPFIVDGDSMVPNFHNGEYLIVDEISQRFKDFQRGEVVVFRPPVDTNKYYIKRVIGLPGETVEIKNQEIVIYNSAQPGGFVLQETAYLPNSEIVPGEEQRVTLGANEYYLMGDNRNNSSDSRRFGPVQRSSIKGRTWLRAFPFSSATFFNPPIYPNQ